MPLAPLPEWGCALSCQAVPAMSKCAHGVPSTNSSRNLPAVMVPARRSAEALRRSLMSPRIDSRYSGSIGNGQKRSPQSRPCAAIASARSRSLLIRATRTLPRATLTAPVNVAASIMCVAPRRVAYTRASAKTKRPSASVLITSMVLPFMAVTISPGRVAVPLGMFSAIANRQLTRTDGCNRPMAVMAPSMVAAPAMSYFICSMLLGGFSDRPPVSKVMPLPMRNK